VIRKLCMFLVIAVGVFWVASPLVLDYPTKTQAVDNLTNALRPAYTDAALDQAEADLATSTTFADDFQTKALPAFAARLGMTPAQFNELVARQYPAVSAGMAELPTILSYFNGLQQTMASQQANFEAVDATPNRSVPMTSIHWQFVILGVGAIGIGILGLSSRRRAAGIAGAALGIAVIGLTLVLSVPAKTAAAEELTTAFRPVFTEQSTAQARDYVETLQAMDTQLTGEAMPTLAAMLQLSPEQLAATMRQEYPTVSAGLQELPAVLTRLDGLVTIVEHNVDNFQIADSFPSQGLPATAIGGQLVVPAAVLLAASLTTVVARRRPTMGPVTEATTGERELVGV
jgi:hypothetical protein